MALSKGKILSAFLVLVSLAGCQKQELPPTAQTPLQRLIDGNQRYVAGHPIHPDQGSERRQEILTTQQPFAIVLGCSDSRVAPEIVFDQGLGDLFVVRVAGNVVQAPELDTIEFAADKLKSSLIFVLGHQSCAAVTAVVEGKAAENNLEALEPLIQPAVDATKDLPGDPVTNAIKENVRLMVERLTSTPVLNKLIADGSLTIVGGYYHLADGKVEILQP
jgi:carbonic anhydrase